MNVFRWKRILIIWVGMLCGFLSAAAGVSHAQGNAIPYNRVNYNFYDMKFLDAKTGWLCGKSGMMFRTENGGLTWLKVELGTDDSIFAMKWLNRKRAIVVGQAGLVMATDDAGQTWQKVEVPTDKALLTVDFFDENIGIACGDWGKMIATNDGGRTWNEASLDEDILLYCVKFTGPEEAWIAAEAGNIFHTLDGGKTWEKKEVSDGTLFGIAFDNRGNGVAVGIDGTVLHTKDKGENWVKSTVSKESLYAVSITDQGAIIVGDAATIFISSYKVDGSGEIEDSWKAVETPADMHANWLNCVARPNGNRYVVAGARGSISFIENFKLVTPGT
ncbi:MAG: YCF48-related protein [Syntrophobacteraceae bacterium]